MYDVLVVGSGPAGAAIAAGCADRRLHTALLAPDQRSPWPATYAAWADELPADLPLTARAATVPAMRAVGTRPHELHRPYVVLDNLGLRRHLHRPAIAQLTGLATRADVGRHGGSVRLADGRRLAAAIVIDASGPRRVLSGGPPRPPVTEQVAAGFVLPADAAAGLLDGAAGVFMDWRWPAADAVPAASFLYAVPTGPNTVLVEETSLAHRPGLPSTVLRRRLRARLAAGGLGPGDAVGEERVRFPVDPPRPRTGGILAFGTAAGLQHPATGYSVAAALTLAPRVADAIARALPDGPPAAVRAANRTIWSPAARAVHGLRRHGLSVMLGLPPARVAEFFDAFFELPTTAQHAYLSERENMAGITATMSSLFMVVPWTLRWHLLDPRNTGAGPA